MTIAGHSYSWGRCACGRLRADVNSLVREAIARGVTLVNETGIAHTGSCTSSEWDEIVRDIASEDTAIVNAMQER